METLIGLFQLANSLSPLAIIGLLVGLLYIAMTQHKMASSQTSSIQEHFDTLRTNDLHELHDMAETLRRIEVQQTQGFATVIAKLNGKG